MLIFSDGVKYVKNFLPLLLFCGVIFPADDSEAATYRIEAEATISIVGSAFTSAGFETGQSASLIWEYDSNSVATGGGSFSSGYSDNPTSFVSMTFKDQTYSESSTGGTSLGFVLLSDGTGPASGQIFAQGETFPITFAGVSGLTFQIFAVGSGDLLTGTDLSQIPDLDELDLGRSFFRLVDGNGTSKNLTATFTSATFTDLSAEPETTPVPVPAALPLLLGGISLFGALKLRRSGGARGRAAT